MLPRSRGGRTRYEQLILGSVVERRFAAVGLGVVGSIIAAIEALPSANTALVTLLAGDGILDGGNMAVTPPAISKRHGGSLGSR